MKKTLLIHKGSNPGKEVPSVTIIIDEEISGLRKPVLDEGNIMQDEAERLHYALLKSLPGGTYSRLYAEMTRHAANNFVYPRED